MTRFKGWRRKVGQAILEFALVGGFLILLVLGVIVFGQLFSWLHTLNNAAREGARLGALCKPDEEIIATIREMTERLPNAESITITIDPSGVRRHGDPITVTISYDAPILPIPGILSSPRRLVAEATMRMICAQQDQERPTFGGETCNGQTCNGQTCNGKTCEGRTCRGQTCGGRTCSGPGCQPTRGIECQQTRFGPGCQQTQSGPGCGPTGGQASCATPCVGLTCGPSCAGPTCGGGNTCGGPCYTQGGCQTMSGNTCGASCGQSTCAGVPGCGGTSTEPTCASTCGMTCGTSCSMTACVSCQPPC